MTFQLVSDLHLELFPGFRMGGRVTADYLILAGDVGDPLTEEYADFLEDCAKKYVNVFVVLGNHELYNGMSRAFNARVVQDIGPPNVVLLDRSRFDIAGTELRVVGTTLWSRIPAAAMRDVRHFNDFNRIKGMTVAAYNEMHDADVTWLAAEKVLAEVDGKRLVVVTHHAPYTRGTSHANHVGAMNCMFATDLSNMFGPPIAAWAHGHTHFSSSQVVGGTLLVSNQRGYADTPSEGVGFEPDARINFN